MSFAVNTTLGEFFSAQAELTEASKSPMLNLPKADKSVFPLFQEPSNCV